MTNHKPIRVTIESMAHGGSGIAKQDKQVIFIPYTIPGEVLEARIIRQKGRVAFGQGITLHEASVDRVYPRCDHFGWGKCGRCQWQHIAYDAQLLLKQDVLADQLERIGGLADVDVQSVVPSPVQWRYLHHLTFTIAPDGQIGLPSTDEGLITLIEQCHIIHPDLMTLYQALEFDFIGMSKLRLAIGSDGATMVILYIQDEDDIPELHLDLPASVNAILPDGVPINLIGDTHSRYIINGRSFRVTAGCDYRPNIAQIPTLSTLLLNVLHMTSDDSVAEFYGGCGFISASIAPYAKSVMLIESYPPAAHDASINCADLDNITVVNSPVEAQLHRLNDFSVVILDPPSAGLSLDVVDGLGTSSVRRIAYVSSDPATLARDCKRLVDKGYHLNKVYPIDLHPQTYYIDAVAILEK